MHSQMRLSILLSLASTALAASQCGLNLANPAVVASRFERAIFGGNHAPTGKWPWQVALTRNNGLFCGGTIISNQWILTAAHCIGKSNIVVFGGISHINQTRMASDKGFSSNVVETKIHPNYEDGPNNNDIALIKLEKSMTFDDSVYPICLPNPDQSIPNDGQAVATGFGATNVRGTATSIGSDGQLGETIVPIIEQNLCEKRFRNQRWSEKKTVCAGSSGHGVGSGDSGGPLIMKATDGRWFQLGVSSFMADVKIYGLSSDLLPNVFTDVRPYCDWIKETTGGEATCQDEQVILQDVEIQV